MALEPSQWTPDVRKMLDPTGSGRYIIAIYRTFAQHPKLYPPRQLQSEHIRLRTSLSPYAKELLILRTGWLARSEYEWSQHAPAGREAGLDVKKIAAGPDAPGWSSFDVTLIKAADELYRDDFVSDATWRTLAERYSAKELLDVADHGWWVSDGFDVTQYSGRAARTEGRRISGLCLDPDALFPTKRPHEVSKFPTSPGRPHDRFRVAAAEAKRDVVFLAVYERTRVFGVRHEGPIKSQPCTPPEPA